MLREPIEMDAKEVPGRRVVSLDQFRGYTVAGMLFVNFLGGYQVVPAVFKHHNTYCSYADTIMPQFFFAVGFAFRLTFLKRFASSGYWTAARAALKRNAGLLLLGVVIYHLDGRVRSWADLSQLGVHGFLAQAFQRDPFQTLVHIAITSIWILPVIAAGTGARVAFIIASAGLHLWLSSQFYLDWAWKRPVIDGGPLGFLTWTIPTLVGSLAYDVMAVDRDPGRSSSKLGAWSVLLMLLGYAFSCLGGGLTLAPPPFVPPAASTAVELWTMSQRTGSVAYLTFAAGFSLAVYALFVVVCDRYGWQSAIFRVFGQNALAAYIIHPLVAGAVKPYLPNDAPAWYVTAGFALYFGICVLFNRHLEKHGLFLRL
jgi:predicted acyltransferase